MTSGVARINFRFVSQTIRAEMTTLLSCMQNLVKLVKNCGRNCATTDLFTDTHRWKTGYGQYTKTIKMHVLNCDYHKLCENESPVLKKTTLARIWCQGAWRARRSIDHILGHRTLLVARKIRFSCPSIRKNWYFYMKTCILFICKIAILWILKLLEQLQIPVWRSGGDSHHRLKKLRLWWCARLHVYASV